MTVTRLGIQLPSFTFPGIPDTQLFEHLASLAGAAEQAGFDSLWVMDHFYQIAMVGRPEEAMLEGYTTLAALSARTVRLNLGTMVTGVTYRNPALLAKVVTTLDIVSAGRAILGIGAAWNEQEHAGYGFDFPPVGERMERLEEALQICRAMFRKDRPTFDGRHYRIERALNNPRPLRGDIPILVGGSGERRTLRLVAQYADACNLFGDPATLRHKIEVLEQHCADVGRDPGEITKTALCALVVARGGSEADEQVRRIAKARGTSVDQARAGLAAGGPEQIAEQIRERVDAGLDGIVCNFPAGATPDGIFLAGEALADVVPA
jgi:F420-dependent oxidoreductase-like protein